MSRNNNTVSAFERYEIALKEANLLNKASVFDALDAARITRVSVNFDGEGDSGQIEAITAFGHEGLCDLPTTAISLVVITWGGKGHTEQPKPATPLRDVLETLCYEFLSQEHGGWENNDGAFGTFEFNVAKRTIWLEFNARFSDFVTTCHGW